MEKLFQAPPSESVNPLQDLQDRIKALKEEMKLLLENTGGVRGPSARENGFGKIGYGNGLGQPGMTRYRYSPAPGQRGCGG